MDPEGLVFFAEAKKLARELGWADDIQPGTVRRDGAPNIPRTLPDANVSGYEPEAEVEEPSSNMSALPEKPPNLFGGPVVGEDMRRNKRVGLPMNHSISPRTKMQRQADAKVRTGLMALFFAV